MGTTAMKRDRKLSELIVQTVREPLLVLDASLRVSLANHAFYETFRVAQESTVGTSIYDLANHCSNLPELHDELDLILRHGAEAADLEVECELPQIGRRAFMLSVRSFRHEDGQDRILLMFHDHTDRKR